MKKIILAGNSITAEILYGYISVDPRYQIVGTVVDDDYVTSTKIHAVRCVGISEVQSVYSPTEVTVVMAMGYNNLNRTREAFFTKLMHLNYVIEPYIHPDACVYSQYPVGSGSVVLPRAVVEPYARIGINTMIWCNTTIAHHSDVGDNCWIASGTVIAGQAKVGRNTFVGVNATIVNEVTVAELNMIGAGALITKHTKPNSVHLARSAEEWRFSAEEYTKHFGV
jgi:sugar O-acyltransferase (sialic acid O-acetyltransferase NeuD family)